ncbi:4Fe-4S binding protein [Methanocaldococcus sp.]
MLKNYLSLERINIRNIYVIKEKCVFCKLCKEVCPTNCIYDEEFCVNIDKERCAFCGRCVKVCPTKAIVLERKVKYFDGEKIVVKEVTKYNDIHYFYFRCISCLICVKNCPFKAMSVKKDRFKDKIIIDKEKCELCGKCEEVCPTKAIYLEGEF